MAPLKPIFAKASTAARLLDLTENEFKELVQEGHLPKPSNIGGIYARWDVEMLKRILSGHASDGMEDVRW